MKYYLLFFLSFILISCFGKKNNSLADQSSQQLLPYHIQLIAVGPVDSTHWNAAYQSLQEYFPQAVISTNKNILPIKADQYLVKGKLDAGKQLSVMAEFKPDSVNTLLAITAENIAVPERTLSNGKKYKNWSVLGLGSLQRGVCIISY